MFVIPRQEDELLLFSSNSEYILTVKENKYQSFILGKLFKDDKIYFTKDEWNSFLDFVKEADAALTTRRIQQDELF